MQLRETPVKAGGRGLPAGADQQRDPLGVQAAADEGQRLERTAVDPMGVIGEHRGAGSAGKVRQQGQDGHPGQQRVRCAGVRRQAKRPHEGLGLQAGEGGGGGQDRPQERCSPANASLDSDSRPATASTRVPSDRARSAVSASSTVLPIPAHR